MSKENQQQGETDHLLSTEVNKKRLMESIGDEPQWLEHMAISRYCSPHGNPNPETYAFIEGYKQALAAVSQAPQWVSVEERLPEYEVHVLVYGMQKNESPQMGGNKPKTTITSRLNPKGTSIEKSRDLRRYLDDNDFRGIDVTHWMPLPQPPKTN